MCDPLSLALILLVGKAKAALLIMKIHALIAAHGSFHAAHPFICSVVHSVLGTGASELAKKVLELLGKFFK